MVRAHRIFCIHCVFIIAGIVLNACSYWQPVSKITVSKERKKTIRVHLTTGAIIETRRYYFLSDTLVLKAPNTLIYKGDEQKIPPEKIEKIEMLYVNWGESLVLFIVSAGIITIIISALSSFGAAIQSAGT